MGFNLIDIQHWDRKPYFEHYLKDARCTYSITVNIDITDLLHTTKKRDLKLYPVLIYMISAVVNRHQEFRICFDAEGQLGFWDQMNPNYTIFHKDTEKFTNIWTIFDKSLIEFYTNYMEDVKAFDNNKDFIAKPNEPLNTFPISAIPWVSFTGFNLNIYTEGTYLLPIFTTGKYFSQDEKILLPLSVQVHHAVCDGFHTSRLINEMQQMAFSLKEWLK